MNLRNLALLAAAILLSSLFVNAQLNALAGRFDRTYGEDGFALIGQSLQPMDFCCFQELPDKRVVVVLSVFDNKRGPSIWITRLLSNGSPDLSFGTDGYVRLPNSDGFYAYSSELQPDGKVLIAGQAFRDQPGFDMFVTRVHPNGSLDTAFGNNGNFLLDLTVGKEWSTEVVHSLRFLSDGKIFIGGIRSFRPASAPANHVSSVVARLNSDGTLDNSFGSAGIKMVLYGYSNFLSNVQMSIQADGKILFGISSTVQVSGPTAYSTRVMRFLPNGDLDPSFAKNGIAEISTESSFSFEKIEQLDDGKILCLSGLYRITKINNDGTFDNSFGNSGKINLLNFSAYDLSVLPNRKILASGYLTVAEPPFGNKRVGVVARLLPDGTSDIRFGQTGLTRVAVSENDVAYGPVAIRNGSFLALGSKRNLNDSPQSGRPVLSRFLIGK